MKKPRHTLDAKVLALSALLLLPACSPRKAIPSDPPEVRTEAQVRGAQRVKLEEPAAQPVAEAAPQTVLPQAAAAQAEVKAAVPTTEKAEAQKVVETKSAEVKAEAPKGAESAAAAVKPVQAKVEAASADAKAAEVKVETKAVEAKPVETKAIEAKAGAKTPEAKDAAVKAETVQAIAADAAQQAAAQAPKSLLVQIASFNTEKNAQGALSWLKGKGYSEARVVRVEQGQAVYHRVQAGPFQDPAATRKALEELKADWPQAFIPAD